jgi:Na+/H+ antiporter NhaD/arsenite permease-like protein
MTTTPARAIGAAATVAMAAAARRPRHEIRFSRLFSKSLPYYIKTIYFNEIYPNLLKFAEFEF